MILSYFNDLDAIGQPCSLSERGVEPVESTSAFDGDEDLYRCDFCGGPEGECHCDDGCDDGYGDDGDDE